MKVRLLIFAALAVSFAFPQSTPSSSSQSVPTVRETVEVTATRLPEDPNAVPAAIEVITGEELSAMGARDLRSGLSLARGVAIAPGGDAGPASSVPDFWGLKEFDAFLLVVDGVPWGGTFNPALLALNLSDVERIEILRGPAAVMYGATSFVGVIQVVHKDTTAEDHTLDLHGGAYGSGGGSFSTPVPLGGDWSSRLTLEGERMGFSDDRTSFRRGHGYWRVGRKTGTDSRLWFNADLNWLDQDPASPRPREGRTLSPLVPVDANQNPEGAFLNEHRGTFFGGFDRAVGSGTWGTTLSVSHGRQDAFRGFLTAIEDVPDNTHGFREQIHLTDVYLDSHVSHKLGKSVRVLIGGDYLHGTGNAKGADFDYTSTLLGNVAPVVVGPDVLDFQIHDNRDFFGGYGTIEWNPFERLRIDGGIRLNVTRENQQVIDGGAGTSEEETRTDVRPGASVGAMLTAWRHNSDSVGLFVNYRDTFKPAAIDFGIGEDEGGGGDLILKPETARSVEGGLKGRFLDRRLELEASAFLMDFNNLVTPTNVNGVPAIINAGTERFKGFETGASIFLPRSVVARATYSYHDARFTDFVQDFDGVPTQLGGRRVEMSAHNLAAFGINYSPVRGLLGGIGVNYTGSRFLDKRNRALADGFATVDLSAGYRTPRWEFRVDARNLGDRRDPVAESEFGDAQYYLMTSRRVDVGLRLHF